MAFQDRQTRHFSRRPQQYTECYDVIVTAIHAVSPQTKYVGLALAMPSLRPAYFEYFLDHSNHRPGVPLDMISDHFYASPVAADDRQLAIHVLRSGRRILEYGAVRRLLLANKRNRAVDVELPDATGISVQSAEAQSGDEPARSVTPSAGKIHLEPFAVAIVSW
jgi:hypothetical protein